MSMKSSQTETEIKWNTINSLSQTDTIAYRIELKERKIANKLATPSAYTYSTQQ